MSFIYLIFVAQLKTNKTMNKGKITQMDYIKANRKASREMEISTHGKQISMRPTKVHNPKNDYKRSKMKKVDIFDEDLD